jgi:hypothetical protein
VPVIVADAGDQAVRRFLEFFHHPQQEHQRGRLDAGGVGEGVARAVVEIGGLMRPDLEADHPSPAVRTSRHQPTGP